MSEACKDYCERQHTFTVTSTFSFLFPLKKLNGQAFQNFVDARLQPETDDLDIVFFDASIAAKRNRSMRSFIKKDANFLR